MRILKVCASGECQTKGIDNTLEALQAEVGGYIEPVKIFADKDITALANEEGLILGLPGNKRIPGVFGDVIFVGVKGEDFCSLTSKQAEKLKVIFGCLEKAAIFKARRLTHGG